MATISNRPEIDGLRAVAVIPVILFHMGFKWIAGGYIGVDVFFVISGFLITSILKKELESKIFSFREFWSRRIRRILPAMITVTTATLCFTYLFAFRPDRLTIAKQATAALLSFANIYFWRSTGDYWGTKAEESPFLHTWSLSVEEQFYLAFPVMFFVIFRIRPQWLQGFTLAVLVSSLTLFLYGSIARPTATFYLLPTRGWELATGCYLALIVRDKSVESTNSISFSGLALSGLCMVIASFTFIPTLNGGIAIGVLGAALIIAFGQSGICNTMLSQRHIVHIGKISYSLYLWHWPVLIFAKQFGFSSHNIFLAIPMYMLSITSYYLVETPTRRRKGIVPAIAACYMLSLVLCVGLAFSSPYYDTTDFEPNHWNGLYYDLKPRNEMGEEFKKIIATMDVPARDASPEAYRNGGIIVGKQDNLSPRIVVLGDSHGVMWADAIRFVAEALRIKTSIITMNGEGPFVQIPLSREKKGNYLSSEERYAYDKSRLELIESWKPDLTILCCRWSDYREADTKELLDFLEQHSARTLLMEQPPELADVGNRNALQYLVFRGIKPAIGVKQYLPIGNSDKVESGRTLVREIARKRRSISYIPTFDLFVKESDALVLDGKNVVYVDDDHLTTYGARLARPRIEDAISEELYRRKP